VYRARDTRLGRDVAIKVLPAHLSDNLDLKQRMEREARANFFAESSETSAPCTISARRTGSGFLVMEHLEGETLADRLRRERRPSRKR